MEKKRRARINDSLDTLKQILLDNRHNLLRNSEQWRQFSAQQQVQLKTTKLEKADILEMTVNYLRVLHHQMDMSGHSDHSSYDVSSTSGCSAKAEDQSAKCENSRVGYVEYSVEDKENYVPRPQAKSLSVHTELTRSKRSAFQVIQKRSAKVGMVNQCDQTSANNCHWRPW